MTVPAYRASPAPQPAPGGHDPREAVDDLFRRHALGLVRFALMLVGDQATAEDVVQEAFLGLYRAWDRVRDPDAVLGYLRTAVVNGARSAHRSRGRARLLRVPHDPPVWSAEAALPTGSAPGGITVTARRVYQQEPILGPGNRVAWLDSALISPDGGTVYLATSGNSASGKVVTALTAYRTAGGASHGTVTTFDGGLGEVLTPAGGGMLLAWNLAVSTAYVINPATRTRTTLQLHGVPRIRYTEPPQFMNIRLAW